MPRKVCGLDLGQARVGVAVSDDLGKLAHPRGVISAKNQPEMLKAIAKLAEEEAIERFVIGLPLDMKGGEGEAARKARDIAQKIADATGLDVELSDERLSTVNARRRLAEGEVNGKKAKAHIDEASAVVILQSWLDANRRRR